MPRDDSISVAMNQHHSTTSNPREVIGLAIAGDVLEIGPGNRPFSVAPTARVKYADRSIEGGRDRNFPELVGQPSGVQADYDIDLDTEGLSQIRSASLDGLVVSHVIEHVANPLAVLAEFERVLRIGGKLLLVVPDRTKTFDAARVPTPFSVPKAKYRAGVSEVDEATIREFCSAIYNQAPMHPRRVREWYNPQRLDADRLALHRRRSIHVHAWSPEEFASLLAASMMEGLGLWRLQSMYFPEHLPKPDAIEFAFLLEKVPDRNAQRGVREFVEKWCERASEDPAVDPLRILRFREAMIRDGIEVQFTALALEIMESRYRSQEGGKGKGEDRVAQLKIELDAERIQAERARFRRPGVLKSSIWRITSLLR